MEPLRVIMPEKMGLGLYAPKRYKVFYGGRSGSKSKNIARYLAIEGYIRKEKIICTREIQRSIEDSVHAQLVEEIREIGLSDFYTVTDTSIFSPYNGTEFLFAGLRTNIANIKSIPKLTKAWIEEAQNAGAKNVKILARTVREPNSEIILSLNPELEDDPIYQEYIMDPPTDSIVVKINYYDNFFFPEASRKDMEDDKKKNYQEYLNVWEGQCKQAVEGSIFAEELRLAAEEHRITKVDPVVGVPVHTFWDLGFADLTAIWFIQIVGFEYRVIDYYQSNARKMPHYIEVLAEKNYKYGEHCLPHDGDNDQLAAKSTIKNQLVEALRDNPKLGETVRVVPRIPKKALAIDAARRIFPNCLFDKEKTSEGRQCLSHYAFAKDSETGKVSLEPKKGTIWNHGSDAFLTFAQHFKRPETKQLKSIMMG